MALVRPAAVLLGKELQTEFRTRELLTTTVVFVLMVLVLFSFTFDPTSIESRRFAPGLLWLTLLFAGSLMLHPSFTREQTNDTLAALRLAPIDPTAILAAKILANACFLLVAEAVLLPIFAALYNLHIWPVARAIVRRADSGNAGPGDDRDGLFRNLLAGPYARIVAAAIADARFDARADRERRGYGRPVRRSSLPFAAVGGSTGWLRCDFFDGDVAFRRISLRGIICPP